MATKGFNTAVKSNPLGLFIGIITTAATALITWKGHTKQATDQQADFNTELEKTGKLLGEQIYENILDSLFGKDFEGSAIDRLDKINEILKKKAITLSKTQLEAVQQYLKEQIADVNRILANVPNMDKDIQATQLEIYKPSLDSLHKSLAIVDNELNKFKGTTKKTADELNKNSLGAAIEKVTNKLKELREERLKLNPANKEALEQNEKEIRANEAILAGLKKIVSLKHELEKLPERSLKDAILSDEDVEAINTNIETVQEGINTVLENIAHPKIGGDDSESQGGAFWQALGLGDDATTADKLEAIQQMVMNAWANINQIMANADARQLQQFQKTHDQRKAILDKQLNAGKISYEQYTAQVSQLDAELDKKKRKLAHDAAVRQKEMNLFNAITGTALAIVKAMTADPPMDIILAAIVGAMGALQIGVIASTPVPQLATGNFARVTGMDDGQTYHAALTSGGTGLYSSPSIVPGLGLVGEKAPELVFSGADTQKILNTPVLVEAIKATITGVPQFANGNSTEIIRENNTVTQTFTDPELLALMVEIRNYVKQKPEAVLVANEDYIRTHNQVKQEYDAFQKNVN